MAKIEILIPEHFRVKEYLNNNYPGHWIGREGPVAPRPARSPDCNLLNFYSWDHRKYLVYRATFEKFPLFCVTLYNKLYDAPMIYRCFFYVVTFFSQPSTYSVPFLLNRKSSIRRHVLVPQSASVLIKLDSKFN